MRLCLVHFVIFIALTIVSPATASATGAINFGMPSWPGVTVKTHVVIQIIEAMGYKGKITNVTPPLVYQGMGVRDIDACLATWKPQQDPMLAPLLKAKKIQMVRTNVTEAIVGLCVSEEAWNAGVKSVGDVHKHPDRFDKTIYNIEAGSGMNTEVEKMIKGNVGQLKGWKQIGTSTPVMLAAVEGRISDDEWVVFGCWKPHWMNARMNIRFLEGIPGTESLISASEVYTTTRNGFAEDYPELQKFFERFSVTSATQSAWINSYSYEKIPANEVAQKWIADNLDLVATWLEGVRTADGKDAVEALRARFAK